MKHIMRYTAIASFILILLLIAGCMPEENTPEIKEKGETQTSDKINVVTTVGMITNIVQVVGGPRVEVHGLMGPGVDPHLYKARESDVRNLENAELIFYNGLHLEAQMGEVLEKMKEEKTVVAVSDYIPREELLDFTGYPGLYDPHVWFDVTFWMKATEKVRDSLKEFDPEHAAEYTQRAEAYLVELEKLHTHVQEQALRVSEDQRVLVTAHDAFNYFGRQYGFEVKGLQGISTQAEAGTKDVQDLAAFIADRKIKAIFVESSVSEKNIRAVQEAVRAQGWDVVIGGQLFSDAMGNEGTFEGTYIGMVTHNIDTITSALLGETGGE